jgi:hypothetical protein
MVYTDHLMFIEGYDGLDMKIVWGIQGICTKYREGKHPLERIRRRVRITLRYIR